MDAIAGQVASVRDICYLSRRDRHFKADLSWHFMTGRILTQVSYVTVLVLNEFRAGQAGAHFSGNTAR